MCDVHLGYVYNVVTKEAIPDAIIHVKNITDGQLKDIQHDITSVHGGDYYRLLTPGEYKITAFKEGFLPHSRLVRVTNPYHQPAQRVDFGLKPIKVTYY